MKKWYKSGQALADEIQTTELAEDELAVWNLGQCGFALKKDDMVFLIDPVLNDLLDETGKTKRLYPAGMDPAAVKAEAVFCTHAHRDHMAGPTLQGLFRNNPGILFIVPKGSREKLLALAIPAENILEASASHPFSVSSLSVEPIRTAHPEWTAKEDGTENSLAYQIQAGDFSVLHLGDTYLCSELEEDLKTHAPADVLFAPINGADYFRTKRGCIGNLNPYEAVKVSSLCDADLTIPTHYDMMKGNTCSVLPFVQEMEEQRPGARFALPQLGERLILKKTKAGT